MIKVSRSLKELAYKSGSAENGFWKPGGGEPTITEIAQELHVETEELAMAMDANSEVESLHKAGLSKEGQEIRLMDRPAEKEMQEERILDYLVLKELLASLNKEERRLIYLRYFRKSDPVAGGKGTGDLPGAGFQNGEKNIEKSPGKNIKIPKKHVYYSGNVPYYPEKTVESRRRTYG